MVIVFKFDVCLICGFIFDEVDGFEFRIGVKV